MGDKIMKIVIDEKHYFTGNSCTIGGIIPPAGQTVIETDLLPNETDYTKSLAYKWENNSWIFDESKYNEILAKQEAQKSMAAPTVESLQSKLNYLSMMTGVNFDA